MTVSHTCHTLPSVGYVVWDRRRKLKHEFQGLPGDKIRDLRLSGVDVTQEIRTPLVAYLGDSSPEGLDRCPAMFEAMILITELTFVAHSHRKDKIRDLRLSGVDVTQEIRAPLVAYLGDSSPEGLDRCPAMFEAMILITELTFVAHSHRKEKIHKFGHMHLDDLLARRDRFRNEVVIATHFSTRYTDERIRRTLARRLPDMLDGRLNIWL